VDLQLIARPSAPTIRVALNRIRLCPAEIKGSLKAGVDTMEQQDSNLDHDECYGSDDKDEHQGKAADKERSPESTNPMGRSF